MWKKNLTHSVSYTKEKQNIYTKHFMQCSYRKVKHNARVKTFCKSTQLQSSPEVKRAPPKETYITHGRRLTSVLEACVAPRIYSGGLSDFPALSLLQTMDFPCPAVPSTIPSDPGNIDSLFWGKKLKSAVMKNTRHLLGCRCHPTQPHSVADTMIDQSCYQIFRKIS